MGRDYILLIGVERNESLEETASIDRGVNSRLRLLDLVPFARVPMEQRSHDPAAICVLRAPFRGALIHRAWKIFLSLKT